MNHLYQLFKCSSIIVTFFLSMILPVVNAQTTAKGNGSNGYFTEALLKHLQNGKRIERIFRAVSAEVEKMTNQHQQPEIIDRLKGDLEF